MDHREKIDGQRRVRPLVAAALSFLSWGLGFYYTGRTRLAWYAAFLSCCFAILATVFFGLFLLRNDATANLLKPSLLGLHFGASTIVAFFAWNTAKRVNSSNSIGSRRLSGYLAVYAAPIAGAVIAALLIRSFLFHPFAIPSTSMEPSIHRGEVIVADVNAYRTDAGPQRGDIVVFLNDNRGREYRIYRVIGLPGETVELKNGVVFIDGSEISREFKKKDEIILRDETRIEVEIYEETLTNGAQYLVADNGPGPLDNIGPFHVPDNSYFFLGDNRDFAEDSRVLSAVGFVPRQNLIGPAIRSSNKSTKQN